MSKLLISFSLYGHVTKYTLGLYENLEDIRDFYPGADVRVYIDEAHYAIENIKERWPWVQLVTRPSTSGSAGMFWRLEAACDTNYTHVIVRDVDSRPTHREAHLVSMWIASGKDMHCIRDHVEHLKIPVLGGAHGFRVEAFPSMAQDLAHWRHSYQYGDDEAFLRGIYLRLDRERVLAHSSVGGHYGDEVAIPPAERFVCEPLIPDFRRHLKKLYVVNAPHYENRFRKFCASLKSSEILRDLEVIRVVGCTKKEELVPSWWNQERPHWWLVSQDHKALLRQLTLERTDLALIFEDDGIPNQYFDEYFIRAWNNADPNKMLGHNHAPWTALMLGGQNDRARELVSQDLYLDLARATGGYGQHSILYNFAGLRGFWEHATYWNYEAIDVAFAGYQRQMGTVYCPSRWITDIVGIQFGHDN